MISSRSTSPRLAQTWTLGLLAVAALAPAQAEPTPVWHCQVAGHVTYSDRPCKDMLGVVTPAALTQREVQAADPRTLSQQAEARETARAQERLVRQLQQERQQRERQWARPAPAVIIGLPPDPLARPALKQVSMNPRKPPAYRSAARTSPATAAASRRAPD